MSPDNRITVVNKIDGYYASDEVTWSKQNMTVSILVCEFVCYVFMSNQYCSHILFLLQELLCYVPLKDMVRLRACYWTAKQDSSVIHRIREEVVNSDRLLEMEFDENSLRGVLDQYHWYPIAMKR